MKKYLVLIFILMFLGMPIISIAEGPVFRIRIWDTDRSHYAEFIWNENEAAANRAINWVLNGADRTVNLSADLTLTSAGAALIDDANAAAQRTTLELGVANDVQFADIYHTGFVGTNYYDNGNSGAAITIDWNNGNVQQVVLTAAGVDITFIEPPHPGKCELWIIQDGTGGRTIDWEHEVSPKWPGDVEPVLSTAANAVDVVVFTFIGGTTYRGLFNGDFK